MAATRRDAHHIITCNPGNTTADAQIPSTVSSLAAPMLWYGTVILSYLVVGPDKRVRPPLPFIFHGMSTTHLRLALRSIHGPCLVHSGKFSKLLYHASLSRITLSPMNALRLLIGVLMQLSWLAAAKLWPGGVTPLRCHLKDLFFLHPRPRSSHIPLFLRGIRLPDAVALPWMRAVHHLSPEEEVRVLQNVRLVLTFLRALQTVGVPLVVCSMKNSRIPPLVSNRTHGSLARMRQCVYGSLPTLAALLTILGMESTV